jgi:hypothetical protein
MILFEIIGFLVLTALIFTLIVVCCAEYRDYDED